MSHSDKCGLNGQQQLLQRAQPCAVRHAVRADGRYLVLPAAGHDLPAAVATALHQVRAVKDAAVLLKAHQTILQVHLGRITDKAQVERAVPQGRVRCAGQDAAGIAKAGQLARAQRRADHGHRRIGPQKDRKAAAFVRLHVRDENISKRPAREDFLHLRQDLFGLLHGAGGEQHRRLRAQQILVNGEVQRRDVCGKLIQMGINRLHKANFLSCPSGGAGL